MFQPALPVLWCLLASRSLLATGNVPTPAGAEPLRYQLGLLTRGPTWTAEQTPHSDSIQAGHLANIGRMAKLGVLLAAGPFAGEGDLRGVFVFAPQAGGLDTLLALDPALATQRLQCRLLPWIAPPGLGEDYQRRAEALDRTVAGAPDSMVSFGWVMLRRGPRYDSSPTHAVKLLLGKHRDYIARLRASGQLVYAGDIEGTGELRGVLVMRGDSAAVARAVRADPAVRAQRFAPELLRWWTAWGTIPGH